MTEPGASASNSELEAMLGKLADKEGVHFKHQSRDEPDLTREEKMELARSIFTKSPGQFLARFHAHLAVQDCACFEKFKEDYEVAFYLKEISARKVGQTVKNRRYRAMERLMADGEYFSYGEMKQRDPLLFEQLVGRFSTDEERGEMLPVQYNSFSGFLLSNIDRNVQAAHLRLQKQLESNQVEEEDDDDEEEDEEEIDDEKNVQISDDHKTLLRNEFLSIMQHRFLNGEDRDFDYNVLDADQTLDDHKERDLDCEERYFDDEDSASVHTLSTASSQNFIHRTDIQSASGDMECEASKMDNNEVLTENVTEPQMDLTEPEAKQEICMSQEKT